MYEMIKEQADILKELSRPQDPEKQSKEKKVTSSKFQVFGF